MEVAVGLPDRDLHGNPYSFFLVKNRSRMLKSIPFGEILFFLKKRVASSLLGPLADHFCKGQSSRNTFYAYRQIKQVMYSLDSLELERFPMRKK
jgi:hypothetical protein